MIAVGGVLAWGLAGLSLAGTLYTLAAAVTLWRFYRRPLGLPPLAATPGVTLLKPLYGAEPHLTENLASFIAQTYGGPVQMLCAVRRADDPAIAAVEALKRRYPAIRIDLVIDSTPHGSNRKIANLINLQGHIAHDVVVLSDSDMVAGDDYLTQVVAALDKPGTGAVTLAYNARGDLGLWSRLGAAGLSWQFWPGAVLGSVWRLAQPCMGSTIALRRSTLEKIGGFAPFADVLADDHAIGMAVKRLGLDVTVAPVLVTHASTEPSLAALWRHEIRWGATVRDVEPVGYVLSVIAMPLPLAFLVMLAHGPVEPGLVPGLVIAALLARLGLAWVADRVGGSRSLGLWWLPLRDVLSFMVFCASLTTRSVDWRGSTLKLQPNGRILAEPESPGL